MNVLALVVIALVQFVSLDLPRFRETIEAMTTALVDQYVEPAAGTSYLGAGPPDLPEAGTLKMCPDEPNRR